jgi:uncharacterized membrane protein YdbT with pleckstrin-like domain
VNKSPVPSTSIEPAIVSPKERILFETRPLVLPAILTFENLTLVGMVVIIVILSVFFHLGMYELLIIAVLWALLAFPSFQFIFQSGSTSYLLTNRRLVIFTFSLRQNEQSIPLEEIQSATCKHSGLQRLYGAGDILVVRKGLRKMVRLRALSNCRQYADQINQAIKPYKK